MRDGGRGGLWGYGPALGSPHLHGEDDDREADSCGDAHRHDDCLCVIKAGDHAHHVGQADGQDRLQKRITGGLECVELLFVQPYAPPFPVPQAGGNRTEVWGLPERRGSRDAFAGSRHNS